MQTPPHNSSQVQALSQADLPFRLHPGIQDAYTVESAPSGWLVSSSQTSEPTVILHLREKDYPGALACRLTEPEDSTAGSTSSVVQLGIGKTTSRLCNALYCPQQDRAFLFKAQHLHIVYLKRVVEVRAHSPLSVVEFPDFMKQERGISWFTPLDRSAFPRPPAGWCSWYTYYLDITEAEVLKNTDWLALNLRPYGLEWVQVDDGWQGKGYGWGANRDWFKTCAGDFPHGMAWLASYIRAQGLKPGIWCIPFTQSDPELFRSNPALFLRRPDGSSPGELSEPQGDNSWPEEDRWVEWAGRYFVDLTSPAAGAYLQRLANQLCDLWGYDYVKLDAQGMMVNFYQQNQGLQFESATGAETSLRLGLQALKEAVGPYRFLLCCAQALASVGLCQGLRTGTDVEASWQGMQAGIQASLQFLYLNTLAFYTDPDVVCVREPLTLEQARLWASFVSITGQLLMNSDPVYILPAGRVRLLQRIMPVADIHPMELYPLRASPAPELFDLKVNSPGVGAWDVLALFNWDASQQKTFLISPSQLGLPAGDYFLLDSWDGYLVHYGDGCTSLVLHPMSCRVIAFWPDLARPQVVGSSRHLTQGADDLAWVRWDEQKQRLSGCSRVLPEEANRALDPYHLRVFVPAGWELAGDRSGGDNSRPSQGIPGVQVQDIPGKGRLFDWILPGPRLGRLIKPDRFYWRFHFQKKGAA